MFTSTPQSSTLAIIPQELLPVRGGVLHVDPWPNYQSGILCTRHTCENKRKQPRGWTEMCGCYEMKWYMQMAMWDTGRLSVWVLCQSQLAMMGALASDWALHGDSGPQQASGWVLPGQEAEEVLVGPWRNTTWYGQKKLWVSVAVSIHLPPSICLSHTTEDLTPFEN